MKWTRLDEEKGSRRRKDRALNERREERSRIDARGIGRIEEKEIGDKLVALEGESELDLNESIPDQNSVESIWRKFDDDEGEGEEEEDWVGPGLEIDQICRESRAWVLICPELFELED